MITEATNIVNAAKNLPSTMPVMVTGAVKSSCSVLIFLSSAKSLIVSKGMRITMEKIISVKYIEVS